MIRSFVERNAVRRRRRKKLFLLPVGVNTEDKRSSHAHAPVFESIDADIPFGQHTYNVIAVALMNGGAGMKATIDAVTSVHVWGNRLLARAAAVTDAEVREMWTEDGSMTVNGQLKCAGIRALVKHFEELRAKLKSAEVQLPYAITVESGRTVAARYVINVEHLDGTRDKIHVGAFFTIENGKIRSMDEVVSFEKSEITLEEH